MTNGSTRNIELALIIPVYNEGEAVADVLKNWKESVSRMTDRFIIMVYNDGSSDNTKEVLDRFSGDPSFTIIHKNNEGHGRTIRRGYQDALDQGAEWIFQTDSDNQVLPEDFPRLWNGKSPGKMVSGIRYDRRDPGSRLLISSIMRSLLYILFGVNINDPNVPYRLLSRDFLIMALPKLPSDLFAPNIFLSLEAAKKGRLIDDIPITHLPRQTGEQSLISTGLMAACFTSFLQIFRHWLKYSQE